jgi:hypothetical protein
MYYMMIKLTILWNNHFMSGSLNILCPGLEQLHRRGQWGVEGHNFRDLSTNSSLLQPLPIQLGREHKRVSRSPFSSTHYPNLKVKEGIKGTLFCIITSYRMLRNTVFFISKFVQGARVSIFRQKHVFRELRIRRNGQPFHRKFAHFSTKHKKMLNSIVKRFAKHKRNRNFFTNHLQNKKWIGILKDSKQTKTEHTIVLTKQKTGEILFRLFRETKRNWKFVTNHCKIKTK